MFGYDSRDSRIQALEMTVAKQMKDEGINGERLTALRKEAENRAKEVGSLKRHNTSIEQEIEQCKEKAKEVEEWSKEIKQHRKIKVQWEKEISQLELRCSDVNTERANLQETILKGQVKNLEAQILILQGIINKVLPNGDPIDYEAREKKLLEGVDIKLDEFRSKMNRQEGRW